MNAENNSSDNAEIKKDANAGKSNTKPNTPIELENRIDALEQAIEDSVRKSEYFENASKIQKEVQDYVEDLKAELRDIKIFRLWVTIITIGFSVILFGSFSYFLIFPPCWFSELEAKLKIPFLASLSIMSVLLMSLCLRGVYQTHKDRNYGDFVPESLKIMLKGSGADA